MAGKPRSIKLKSVADVNRYLAKLVNCVNRGEMDAAIAAKQGYLCNSLLNGLRRQDIEARMSKLERMVNENGKSSDSTQ